MKNKKQVQLKEINVFTDEWLAYMIYCTIDDGIPIISKLFPDMEREDCAGNRGMFFANHTQSPLIWINAEKCKTHQMKLLTLMHECNHLVKWVGKEVRISDEQWECETLEYVVSQGIKLLNIKRI